MSSDRCWMQAVSLSVLVSEHYEDSGLHVLSTAAGLFLFVCLFFVHDFVGVILRRDHQNLPRWHVATCTVHSNLSSGGQVGHSSHKVTSHKLKWVSLSLLLKKQDSRYFLLYHQCCNLCHCHRTQNGK